MGLAKQFLTKLISALEIVRIAKDCVIDLAASKALLMPYSG